MSVTGVGFGTGVDGFAADEGSDDADFAVCEVVEVGCGEAWHPVRRSAVAAMRAALAAVRTRRDERWGRR
ncbi:MAG TPA: hypothetical protein VG369_10280 [Humibacter sp.]|nr:hypothetical protein [Humibacter sp.]